MPVRPTLGDLGAPGWGEPWFPLSVLLLLSHVFVWRWFVFACFFLLCLSRHTNPSDKTSSTQLCLPVYMPICRLSSCFLLVVCFLFLFGVFVAGFVFVLGWSF